MIPELAILEKEPIEVHICKLEIWVRNTQTKMVWVQLDLNLQIIEK